MIPGRILNILLCLVVSVQLCFGSTSNSTSCPDFAYPKSVVAQSRVNLDCALKDHDSQAIVRSLMNLYIAETIQDSSAPQTILSEIDSIATHTDDSILKALLLTLEADIYMSFYSARKWIYDSRNTPEYPYPSDIGEWNGKQFRTKILNLADSVTTYSKHLQAISISDYASVICIGKNNGTLEKASPAEERESKLYYPTLFDFTTSKLISILNGLITNETVLPFRMLSCQPVEIPGAVSQYDPAFTKILTLYSSLISFHEPGSAPNIQSQIGMLNFIAPHVYSTDFMGSIRQKNELLKELYASNLTSEFSADCLLSIELYYDDIETEKWLFNALTHNIKVFPTYPRINNLKNQLRSLGEQSVKVTTPSMVAPGAETTIKLEIKNVKSGVINVYNVSEISPATDRAYIWNQDRHLKPIASFPITSESDIPFRENQFFSYHFPKAGTYIVVPQIDGVPLSNKRRFEKIFVTSFTLASTSFDTTKIWAINADNGAPVGDAEIFIKPSSSKPSKLVGLTDSNGSITTNESGYVTMAKNADRYATPFWVSAIGPDKTVNEKWLTSVSGYTSLPIYHPGDSVEWVAIVYQYLSSHHRPFAGKDIKAVMRNASYESIDTILVRTDDFGRARGSFMIPADGMTGVFSIYLDGIGSACRFNVSDYKLPSFRVIIDPVENGIPSYGNATIRGRVETYTGFPISDSKISAEISVGPNDPWSIWVKRHGQNSAGIKIATLDTVTDSSGRFNIALTDSILAMSPIPNSVFYINISAVTPAGETQSASTLFSKSMKYIIELSAPENVDISVPSSDFKVRTVNYLDSTVVIPLKYAFLRDSSIIKNGSIVNGINTLDLSDIPSGPYELRITPSDTTLAKPVSRNIVLYRPTDKESPLSDELLWYPSSEITVSGRENGDWLYAVDCPTNLLVTIHTGSEIISQKWVSAGSGMHKLSLVLPDNCDNATAEISLTGKYRCATARVNIKRDRTPIGITFKAESFRDRIVPGSEETWTFRITDKEGNGCRSAVILDMYDKALDAITSGDWTFRPISGGPRFYYSRHQCDPNASFSSRVLNTPGKSFRELTLFTPEYDTYGYPFTPYFGGRLMNLKNARATGASVSADAKEMVLGEVSETMKMSQNSDAGAIYASADSSSAIAELSEEESEVIEDESKNGSTDKGTNSIPEFDYRERDVPLAFFRPMLTTDRDGRLSFSFTVPNANTLWGVHAIAYTDSLLTTGFTKNVFASKPVMVSPNLPRFLRAGDSCNVSALVMNNTDSCAPIISTIELFNVNTAEIITTYSDSLMLGALTSGTINMLINAPTDSPFIGFRIKSSSSSFSDGEQALIPVLPAVVPVTDTYPFYIAPTDTTFAMTLPDFKSGACSILEYCSNPTWYVVTALPGITNESPTTATEAVSALFSTAVAAGLLHDFPEIGKVLKTWTDAGKDSEILTSLLARNDDLKQILLSATPWMLDAKSDTERMTRLALFFDRNAIKASINQSVETLRKLVRDNGGWAWYSTSDKASYWSTEYVLRLLGELNRLGYLPVDTDLRSMIGKALEWYDRETLKTYKQTPKRIFTDYIILHDQLRVSDGFASVDKTVVNSSVQNILASWKQASLTEKAVYSRILASHSYPTMARRILSSLREYAEYSPEQGMHWPSLDNDENLNNRSIDKISATASILNAFAAVEPTCMDIDRIRQWLILQKQATGWGSSASTSAVIAALLITSGSYVAPAVDPYISLYRVNSDSLIATVKPSATESVTGYFKTPIDLPTECATRLNIVKSANSPSWGAIYTVQTDSLTEIKPHEIEGLSISKQFSTTDKDMNLMAASSLQPGDKVIVTLTIHARQDMDYVTVVDERPACFEPTDQLSKPIFSDGIIFYRENRDTATNLFIDHLPKGTYFVSYEVVVTNSGSFASGVASIQSQLVPSLSAHSGGTTIKVDEMRGK